MLVPTYVPIGQKFVLGPKVYDPRLNTRAYESQKNHPDIKKSVEKAYSVFQKVIWPYINSTVNLLRQIGRVVAIKVPEYAERLSKVIVRSGLLSAISILMTIKSLPSDIKSWLENILLHDVEGATIGTLDLLSSLIGVVIGVGSIASALNSFDLIPKIAFFGLIGLPVAIGRMTYSILNNSYHLFHHTRFNLSLPKKITAENIADFGKFLDKKLSDPEELKKRKIHILSRHTDPKVVKIMQDLQEHLKNNPQDVTRANKSLHEMKVVMARKVTLSAISTSMSTVILATMVAGLVFPISSLVLPCMFGAQAALSLGMHAYKTHFVA